MQKLVRELSCRPDPEHFKACNSKIGLHAFSFKIFRFIKNKGLFEYQRCWTFIGWLMTYLN